MPKAYEMARIFKALSDENRIRILQQLRTCEKCGCQLLEELQITQPTLSHHMKLLCDCSLVKSRREGKWMYYAMDYSGMRAVTMLLQTLFPENTFTDCLEKEGENL